MKAPDKIYIRPMLNPSDGYVGIAWAEAHGGMKEYVRKDALIEWIQEVRAIPHENAIIRDLAFQEVVNKLNSM